MKCRMLVGALSVAVLGSVGCSDSDDVVGPGGPGDPPTAPPGSSIQSSGGDAQTGTVGQSVAEPLFIEVRDAQGDGVAGVTVGWASDGGSSLVDVSETTDAQGRASATWRLGTVAGTFTATATAGALSTSFTATARPGAPRSTVPIDDVPLSGTGGVTLVDAMVVRVADEFGNGVPGTPVEWAATGGTLSGSSVTDSAGAAAADWTLPTATGTYAGEAIAGGDTATVTATVVADAATSLVVISGQAQTGEVGAELAADLVVQAEDQFGNPAPGVAVTWAAVAGSLSPADALTGPNGRAVARWQLGTTAGDQSASVDIGTDPVAFTASATAGSPAAGTSLGGDGQSGTVGTLLPDSLAVRVEDQYGNPVAGAAVAWTTSGGGTVSGGAAITDSLGRASAAWTLGCGPGGQAAGVLIAGLASVDFVSTALEGAPALMVLVSGDAQAGPLSALLTDALVVRVSDACGNPLVGVDVDWTVLAGLGLAIPPRSTTDVAGEASTTWLLGIALGPLSMTASVGASLSVGFSATGL